MKIFRPIKEVFTSSSWIAFRQIFFFSCGCGNNFVTMISLISLLLCAIVGNIYSLPDDPHLTYDRLYNAGVEAYLKERWFECATHIKRALDDYKYYTENLSDCRQLCKHHNNFDVKSVAFAETHYFYNAIQRSDCIRRCKKKRFGERPDSEAVLEVRLEFESLKPYDYLQICAFKVIGLNQCNFF